MVKNNTKQTTRDSRCFSVRKREEKGSDVVAWGLQLPAHGVCRTLQQNLQQPKMSNKKNYKNNPECLTIFTYICASEHHLICNLVNFYEVPQVGMNLHAKPKVTYLSALMSVEVKL